MRLYILILLCVPRILCSEKFFHGALARVANSVIPAEAGIQNPSKILDSGSPPAFAGVARNDHFRLLSRILQELLFMVYGVPMGHE